MLELPVSVMGLLLLLLVLSLLWLWCRPPSDVPPFPALALPVVGHMYLLEKNPRELFKKWREKCGDLFSLYYGNRLVIILSGYDLLKETFVKRADDFSDRADLIFFRIRNLGGIIPTSGIQWKEQRSVSLSILRNFGMGKNILAEKIQEEVATYLGLLEDLGGAPTDVRKLTNVSISNVTMSIVVGRRFEHDDPAFLDLLHTLDELVAHLGSNAILNFVPFLNFLPGDLFNVKKVINNIAMAKRFLKKFIDEQKATFDENNIDNFISAYLNEIMKREAKPDSKTTLDERNMIGCVLDLFSAGTETTTTTMQWAMLYLLHHPDVQEKLYQEIDTHVGTERPPTMHDKMNLKYLEAFIMETQRAASIAPHSLPHTTPRDVTVRGYRIPKGAIIFPNLDSVMWSREIWGDPEVFRPERFLDDDGNIIHREELVPFSLGRRACLGESLAKMELFLFLSGLIQRFRLLPAEPGILPSLEVQFGLTTTPTAFRLKFEPRT